MFDWLYQRLEYRSIKAAWNRAPEHDFVLVDRWQVIRPGGHVSYENEYLDAGRSGVVKNLLGNSHALETMFLGKQLDEDTLGALGLTHLIVHSGYVSGKYFEEGMNRLLRDDILPLVVLEDKDAFVRMYSRARKDLVQSPNARLAVFFDKILGYTPPRRYSPCTLSSDSGLGYGGTKGYWF